MAINLLNNISSTGSLTITKPTTDPLLTIHNTTNGGGAAIRFLDTSGGSQPGDLTYRHSDSQSQGGGASWHFVSEPDTVLVVGSGSVNGRFVAKSAGSVGEVDYGFFDDVNTGMVRTSADNVSLVAGGIAGVGVSSTAVSLKHAGTTKLTTLSTGVQIAGDGTFSGDVTVSGGDITLGGTGRIQGVDTVTDGTDAANKAYVDTAVGGVSSGVTSVATTNGITGGTITSTGTIQLDSTVVRTTGSQSISGTKTFTGTAVFTNAGGIQTKRIDAQTGQQLVLNAGESSSYATGQTGESVYLNAESGLEISLACNLNFPCPQMNQSKYIQTDDVPLRHTTSI